MAQPRTAAVPTSSSTDDPQNNRASQETIFKNTLYVNAQELHHRLPMVACIDAMREAFGPDTVVPVRAEVSASLFMPARVGDQIGLKVVGTKPGNPVGIVALFDGRGRLKGAVDGAALTSVRTGAVTGLATDMLAEPNAPKTLVMIGTGRMAFHQIEAVLTVRPSITDVWLVCRERARREEDLADRVQSLRPPGQLTVRVTTDAREALLAADIVNTATPSQQPLFQADWLQRPTVHVNAVGAFRPNMVELPAELLEQAFVVVDDYEAAAVEAGDLIQAHRSPDANLKALLAGQRIQDAARPSLTVFKSVGIGTQDVAAAAKTLEGAEWIQDDRVTANRLDFFSVECQRAAAFLEARHPQQLRCLPDVLLGSLVFSMVEAGEYAGVVVRHRGFQESQVGKGNDGSLPLQTHASVDKQGWVMVFDAHGHLYRSLALPTYDIMDQEAPSIWQHAPEALRYVAWAAMH